MKKESGSKSLKQKLIAYLLMFAMVASLLPGMTVEAEEGEGTGEHVHSWVYSADDNKTIKATCSCTEEGVDLRLVVTQEGAEVDSVYAGEKYEVAVENIGALGLSEEAIPEITYSKKVDGEGKKWETLDEQPKDAGNYRARVTFDEVSMEKEFTIEEKVHKHDWTYSKVEGEEKIIATCSDETREEEVVLRLVVTPEKEEGNSFCEGEDYKVNIENIGDLGLSEEATPKITYSKKGDGEGENCETPNEQQPKDAGNYKAQVTFDEVSMATEITIKEHNFGEISEEQLAEKAEWNDNGSKVTVKLQCANCGGKIEYSSEEIDKTVTTATCVTPGSTTYTATIEIYGNKYVIKKEVKGTINANNHAGPYITSGATAATYNAAGHTGNQICNACKRVTKYGSVIPKKVVRVNRTVYVTWGKTLKINQITKDTSVFQKLTVPNKSKYKKFLSVNERTGTIRVKKYNRAKIKTTIPVKVKVNGKTYSVKVKIKIPAPSKKSVKISKKKVRVKGKVCYRYTFKYRFKGAKKIKVRMVNGSKATAKYFDRYIRKPKSSKTTYIQYTKKTLKKSNNKVTFKIAVYYGKNKTETLTITK